MVFLFSGQGSQYAGMGADLFRHHAGFRQWMLRLDKHARAINGTSVVAQLYPEHPAASRLGELAVSHPAIFMLEFALARTLIEQGIEPTGVLGTSLGEFAAVAVAGAATAEDTLARVIRQAELIGQHCPPGGMLAVLHAADLFHDHPQLHGHCELAGVNYGGHFVVSGREEGLKRVEAFLKQKNVSYQFLPVSYGFHSSLINPARIPYCDYLAGQPLGRPALPVASGCYGKIITHLPGPYLWEAVHKPILFAQAMAALEAPGDPLAYVDVGPSGTLANFARYNLPPHSRSRSFSILTPFSQGLKNLEKLVAGKHEYSPSKPIMKANELTAFVFPGQGSQKPGMGGQLFDDFPDLTRKADQVLGYSIRELCLTDPQKQLNQTQFTQPALFVVNALSYLRLAAEGSRPDYVAGHSVGEYNALFAAGAFDFETGLKLVQKRGELMGRIKGGGMAAVIGLPARRIEEVLRENQLDTIDIANYNAGSQIIISGLRETIDRVIAGNIFGKAGATACIPLNVSGAFHSRYMQAARQELEAFLSQFQYGTLTIPVVANVTAQLYPSGQPVALLADQLTHSVRWSDSMHFLLGRDVTRFEEVGPGDVLKKLIVKIRQEPRPETAVPAAPDPGHAAPATVGYSPALQHHGAANGAATLLEKAVAVAVRPQPAKAPRPAGQPAGITAQSLGSEAFRLEYGVKYAYAAGGMHCGVASRELVARMAKAGCLSFLGTEGLPLSRVEESLVYLRNELGPGQPFGVNVVYNPLLPQAEEETIDVLLAHRVKHLEVAGYLRITPALIVYRLKGARRNPDGSPRPAHTLLAKVSRTEAAELFMTPPPEALVRKLLEAGRISPAEADLARELPVADDVCAETNAGWFTEPGSMAVLLPALIQLRDELAARHRPGKRVRIGAAGGIGTPAAAAAAFVLGADFILTGSVNQCTAEAGLSEPVKDLLAQMQASDTEYAPAGDLFEMGAKGQFLKRGSFFTARAARLYDLYRQYESLEEMDEKTRAQLQERYFNRSFEDVYGELAAALARHNPPELERAQRNPKYRMALVFKWYFAYTRRLALEGNEEQKVNYQVPCSPALGAFNGWVKGTPLEKWQNRHADEIAEKLMTGAAGFLSRQLLAVAR